jgi:hypothetical protein
MYNGELFASPEEREAQRIGEYKDYLISKGYRVKDPPENSKFIIKTLDELIEFFYSRMSLKHKELKYVTRRKAMDRKIMSDFVKSRMAKGINKERAIDECAEMIDILFRYEEKFKFKYPVLSVGILGQKNLSWVTEKIEDFMNSERIKARIKERQAYRANLEKRQDVEMEEESLIQEDELTRLLAEMEETDGQSQN